MPINDVQLVYRGLVEVCSRCGEGWYVQALIEGSRAEHAHGEVCNPEGKEREPLDLEELARTYVPHAPGLLGSAPEGPRRPALASGGQC